MKLFDFLILKKEKAKFDKTELERVEFEKTIIYFTRKHRLTFTHSDKDNYYYFQDNISNENFHFKRSDILLDIEMEVAPRQIIIWFRNKAEQRDYLTFVKTR